MNATERRKQKWLIDTPTKVLERIINSLAGPEAVEKPSLQTPLAGLVQIDSVGQIRVNAIKAELERRQAT